MNIQDYFLPFYEQGLEFLASGPPSQEVTAVTMAQVSSRLRSLVAARAR